MAGLARERALCDGERTELRSGSDPPYAIKRRGKHGKSNCKACHQRRAETEKQETTKDTNKTALDALFVPPSRIVWLLVFCYAPMAGIVLAFKNYRFDLGIFGSEWAGLKHFRKFVTSPEFWMTIKNTLVITSLKLVVCFRHRSSWRFC